MEVVSEQMVTYAKAKKFLEAKSKEKELEYEQNNALEYLKKFSKLSEKKTQELIDALEKVESLKEKHRVIIANFLPATPDELRLLFAHEVVNLSEDNKKTIIAIVKQFL